MKTLADYKDDEALDVWVEILEHVLAITNDDEIVKMYTENKAPAKIALKAIKDHKEDVKAILLAIDDSPLTGVNIVSRLVANINCFMNDEEMRSFFASQVQNGEQNASTPATETTEANGQ